MPRLILLFLLFILIVGFPLSTVGAVENEPWLQDAYPTPYASPTTLEVNIETAHWLIIGAAVIVLIIFVGVAFRRPKS